MIGGCQGGYQAISANALRDVLAMRIKYRTPSVCVRTRPDDLCGPLSQAYRLLH